MPNDENAISLTAEVRANLGESLLAKITDAREGMRPLLDKVRSCRDFYENKLPKKTKPWTGCSNVNIPVTQTDVDTYHAHVNDVILGVNPHLLVRPPITEDDKAGATAIERALDLILADVVDLKTGWSLVTLESLLSGTAIIKLPWRAEYRTAMESRELLDPESGAPVRQTFEVQLPRHVGPKLELVDLEHFVIYPLRGVTIENAVLLGDKYRLTRDEVVRRIRAGVFAKDASERVLDRPEVESSASAETDRAYRDEYEGLQPTYGEGHWFWEIVTGYDWNGDGLEEDALFTLEAETGLIVRASRFPYWHGRRHYVPVVPWPRPWGFFGRSLPEILEHCQREINTIHNQRVDATSIAIAKCFKRLRTGDLEPDDVQIEPGGVIDVSSSDELTELDINPNVPGFEIENVDRDYAESASAVNDIRTGRRTRGEKTATEIGAVEGAAGIRFGDVIRRYHGPLEEIARQIMGPYGLAYQFMSDEELMSYGLSRDMLVRGWRFSAHGNTSTANKVQQREDALFLHNILMANPLVQRAASRVWRITWDLLNAFDRTNPESYIGTLEEAEMLDQAAQAVQGQQMPGGEVGPGAGAGAMAGAGGPVAAGPGLPGAGLSGLAAETGGPG